ncbi:hypothetical protein F4803DRAFT_528877 [Xylaria telfairii]|nr:hypothetical protein F4803DRAFT_528877 [Xylaria telfairii]
MQCPSCGYGSQSTQSDLEASSSTHNASATSYHIPLPDWLAQLDQAVQSAWPKRFIGYTNVAVLMLCWEETYGGAMRTENHRLASVFTRVYKYSVSRWWIPLEDPDRAIYKRMDKFLDDYGHPENLLIIYYAGHARHNPAGGYFPIWQPRSEAEKGKQIDTAIFHPLLVRAEDNSPDVLLLYDCCFSLASHRSNSNNSRAEVEGLFAGGFESKVPIPGQDSFTKHLTDVLATAPDSGRMLTIAELHRQIIVRLQSFHEQAIFDANHEIRRCGITGKVLHTKSVRVTPSHLFLAGNEKPRLIVLRPLKSGKTKSESTATIELKSSEWPKVLLAIRLLDDDYMEQEIRDWILHAPPGVVEFRGLFPSFSSLLLIEVSIEIWDLLPPCPAVFFVSFTANPVRTPQLSPLDRPESTPPTTVPTTESPIHTNRDGEISGNKFAYRDEERLSELIVTEPDPRQTPPSTKSQSPTHSTQGLKSPSNSRRVIFAAQTPTQRTLIHLLDRADVHVHQIIREWCAGNTNGDSSRDKWFFRQFQKKLEEESTETGFQLTAEALEEHQDFLTRYLSTHEFLSHDNPVINISSRLNPLFTWNFEDEAGPSHGSITNPTTVFSSVWGSEVGRHTRNNGARSQDDIAPEEEDLYDPNMSSHGDSSGSTHTGMLPRQGTRRDASQHQNYDGVPGSPRHDMPPDFIVEPHIPWSQPAPSATQPPPKDSFNCIGGTSGVTEPIDSRFCVEHSYKFQPGEVSLQFRYFLRAYRLPNGTFGAHSAQVFKVLWSEPTGTIGGDAPISDIRMVNDEKGQFYVGYRRFIIVSTDESHHSTCVPILTYDRRGCSKKGVKPSKHGIAYVAGQKPKLLRNEPNLGFDPVPVVMTVEGETLARESRIDYSKLITIEHNVKVYFIGRVPLPYFDKVTYAVDLCWSEKLKKSMDKEKKSKSAQKAPK